MKRVAIIVAATLAVAGASYLSVRHYQNYQKLKNHADQVAAQQVQAERQAEVVRQASLLNAFNKLHAECEKGVSDYNALTPAVKAKSASPVCGSEVIQ